MEALTDLSLRTMDIHSSIRRLQRSWQAVKGTMDLTVTLTLFDLKRYLTFALAQKNTLD